MKAFVGLLFGVFIAILVGTSRNCNAVQGQEKDVIKIRIVNNSDKGFTNVSLFSMKFPDLQQMDTSEYKELRYDSLKHDPLIYCMNNGFNYGRYVVIPEDGPGHYTYTIDSVNNKLIYVSLNKTDDN
ncbi:hypothetical protein [Flagellimonas sp. 2504JD4-2]